MPDASDDRRRRPTSPSRCRRADAGAAAPRGRRANRRPSSSTPRPRAATRRSALGGRASLDEERGAHEPEQDARSRRGPAAGGARANRSTRARSTAAPSAKIRATVPAGTFRSASTTRAVAEHDQQPSHQARRSHCGRPVGSSLGSAPPRGDGEQDGARDQEARPGRDQGRQRFVGDADPEVRRAPDDVDDAERDPDQPRGRRRSSGVVGRGPGATSAQDTDGPTARGRVR